MCSTLNRVHHEDPCHGFFPLIESLSSSSPSDLIPSLFPLCDLIHFSSVYSYQSRATARKSRSDPKRPSCELVISLGRGKISDNDFIKKTKYSYRHASEMKNNWRQWVKNEKKRVAQEDAVQRGVKELVDVTVQCASGQPTPRRIISAEKALVHLQKAWPRLTKGTAAWGRANIPSLRTVRRLVPAPKRKRNRSKLYSPQSQSRSRSRAD